MKKALIVDDLEQNIYLLRSILEGYGFEVISARNGAEALEMARSNPPDVAISDLLMPTMDGFALLREWKHDSLLQNIPLIIYTATYTDPGDEELALRLGAARFIIKPMEPEVFLDSVRQVMEADQAGHIPSPPCRIDDETVYYRMYNETLIRKLEEKMLALEQEIIQRKRDEETLWWSEEKYRTLFEGMSQGAFYQAADGRLTDVNPAALQIFGLTRQEFLERTSLTPAWSVIRDDGGLLPGDEHPSMAALRTGLPVKDMTVGILNPCTKEYTWTIVNAIPQFRPGENSPFQVYVTLHDITRSRQAEQQLKAFANRQEALLAAITDVIMEVDANKVYAWANKAGIEFFGDNVVGREAAFYFEGKQATYDRVRNIFQGNEETVYVESWQRRRDGQKRLLAWWCHVLKDAGGNVTGAISTARDITERKKMEESLRQASEKWRATFDAILDPVALLSIDGTVEQCNRAFVDFFGLDYPAVLGRKCHQLIHHTENPIPDCPIVKARASGVREMLEFSAGEKFFLVVADPIKAPDGKITGFVHIMRDITERKLAEAALQAKNAELERFTYSISHDLRSPLVTIRTFMGHLAEDLALGDQAHVAQDLGYINTASQKMVALLDELLQLSRIGRMPNPSVLAPLQDIVQEALALVAGRIDERGVRVTVTENPVLLYGDRVRLVEVFQNLVDNAVKFMGEQKAPLIEIGAEKKNGDSICFVRDNGMGIEPQHTDKLFGLFEKLNSGMEGSGLGLALAKRIIEAHGGKIWAESEGPGKGACFYFTLPRKSSES